MVRRARRGAHLLGAGGGRARRRPRLHRRAARVPGRGDRLPAGRLDREGGRAAQRVGAARRSAAPSASCSRRRRTRWSRSPDEYEPTLLGDLATAGDEPHYPPRRDRGRAPRPRRVGAAAGRGRSTASSTCCPPDGMRRAEIVTRSSGWSTRWTPTTSPARPRCGREALAPALAATRRRQRPRRRRPSDTPTSTAPGSGRPGRPCARWRAPSPTCSTSSTAIPGSSSPPPPRSSTPG